VRRAAASTPGTVIAPVENGGAALSWRTEI